MEPISSSPIPSSNDLQYFINICETQNISRAAERLGVRQSSLSTAMQRLERNFGSTLFIRKKSGVELTKSGHQLLAQARVILENLKNLKAAVVKNETEVAGSYSIGCHPTIGLYAIQKFLPELLSENKSLEIKIHHDHSLKVVEDVISHRLDFAIAVNPYRHPDLVIKELYQDEVTLWTSKASLKKNPDILIYDSNMIETEILLRQLASLKFKRTVTTSSLEMVAFLVASGAGIGILPGEVVATHCGLGLSKRDSKLKHLVKICLVYRADAQRSKAGSYISKLISEKLVIRYAFHP